MCISSTDSSYSGYCSVCLCLSLSLSVSSPFLRSRVSSLQLKVHLLHFLSGAFHTFAFVTILFASTAAGAGAAVQSLTLSLCVSGEIWPSLVHESGDKSRRSGHLHNMYFPLRLSFFFSRRCCFTSITLIH